MNSLAGFLYLFIVIFVVMLIFYLFRAFAKISNEKKRLDEKGKTHVGFVVDTFHELVSKLKDKEKELESLRKIAEQRAEDVESYNRNILQSVPSGVISFDMELMIKSMNFSAEKILGLRAEDAVGKSYDEVFPEPISDILREGKFIERGEIQSRTSDGRRIWLGLTFAPLRDNSGKEIGHILVFTDLTELKALESQAELRKRLSSLGEMSAGIAHELRNPLGVIAGYTKILSKKIDAGLTPTVEAISKEVDAMDRIISDFLSFAKPVEVTMSRLGLHELIKGCLSNLLTGRENIEVALDIGESVYISGDEILLRQVFTNLIQNALEAMPEGGKLAFGHEDIGDFAEITVSDTGHSIPEGIMDKIFLPFYTTKERGTGLGLAIVHKTIMSHCGEISVESAGSGTIFRLRLPARH